MYGASLADVQHAVIRELLGTRTLSESTVNLQDATATFDSVTEPDAKIMTVIDGFIKGHADVTNEALVTLAALQNPVTGYDGYYVQPADTTVYYLWVKNAAGTDYVIQGTYADQVLGGGLAVGPRGDGSIPRVAVPATYAPIAVFKVVTTAVTFTPATTNWNAAGVVAYAAPVSVLPAAVASLTFTEGGA